MTVEEIKNRGLIGELTHSILDTKREMIFLKEKEKQETKKLKRILIEQGMDDFLQINFRKLINHGG